MKYKICKILEYTLYSILTVIYFILHIFPRNENIIVFGNESGAFVGNPKYLYLYISNNDKEVTPIWITEDSSLVSELNKKGYKAYQSGSLCAYYYAIRGEYAIISHNLRDIHWWCLGGATVIQLWHGVSFKNKRYQDKKCYENICRYVYRSLVSWHIDYIITPSEKLVELHAEAFNIDHDRVWITGYPRHDILTSEVTGHEIGIESTVYEKRRDNTRTILYLPTWRQEEEEEFKEKLEYIGQKIKSWETEFVFKPHPKSEIAKQVDSNLVKIVNSEVDIYPLLAETDILITDYSSVFSDFLILDRPILLFPYDMEDYHIDDSKRYFEYKKFAPGPIVKDKDGLVTILNKAVHGGKSYERYRQTAEDVFVTFEDGRASERIHSKIKKPTKRRSLTARIQQTLIRYRHETKQ